MEQHNVAIVVADLSTNDQRIWKELKEDFGRSGIPVNLAYPSTPGGKPIELPTNLSVGNVTEAIETVTGAAP